MKDYRKAEKNEYLKAVANTLQDITTIQNANTVIPNIDNKKTKQTIEPL